MEVRSNFQDFSSKIHGNFVTKTLGKAEDYGLMITDLVGEFVFDQYASMKHGERAYSRKFCNELRMYPEDKVLDSEDAFRISRRYEREAIKYLFKRKVLKRGRKETDLVEFLDYVRPMAKFVGASGLTALSVPLTFPVAINSLGLRLALRRDRNPVICIGKTRSVNLPKGKKFSIMTYNTRLFESNILNRMYGFRDSNIRGKGIARQIRRCRSSVVCLQGTYDTKTVRHQIVPQLARGGYNISMTVKPEKTVGMSPGLFTASYYPIKDVAFYKFSHKECEPRVSKGVLIVTIEIKKGKYIAVANTRLEGPYDEVPKEFVRKGYKEELREWQLKQIKKIISNYCLHSPYEISDIILAGDFHIGRYTTPICKSPYKAVENPEYEVFRRVILKKGKKTGLKFKDLNFPDSDLSFKKAWQPRYPSHEEDHIYHNETGSVSGTLLDTRAFTYQYFIDLVAWKTFDYLVAHPLVYYKKDIFGKSKKMIKAPLFEHVLEFIQSSLKGLKHKKEFYLTIGWRKIQRLWVEKAYKKVFSDVELNLYTRPDCVDHICLAKRSKNIFSKKGHTNRVILPCSEIGLLSDKLITRVSLVLCHH
ncbi:MAG: hypothetical protein K940chlam3_00087 [Chlamydiae bacterium]|nr:hypothetical protein [Chlamydiota bacterium]